MTLFSGPWESNIRAPVNKSHILPAKIFHSEGAVSGTEAVLKDETLSSSVGRSWVIRPGGLTTFEFAESIGGRYAEVILMEWAMLIHGRVCFERDIFIYIFL